MTAALPPNVENIHRPATGNWSSKQVHSCHVASTDAEGHFCSFAPETFVQHQCGSARNLFGGTCQKRFCFFSGVNFRRKQRAQILCCLVFLNNRCSEAAPLDAEHHKDVKLSVILDPVDYKMRLRAESAFVKA